VNVLLVSSPALISHYVVYRCNLFADFVLGSPCMKYLICALTIGNMDAISQIRAPSTTHLRKCSYYFAEMHIAKTTRKHPLLLWMSLPVTLCLIHV
jgi:hypothetical protein